MNPTEKAKGIQSSAVSGQASLEMVLAGGTIVALLVGFSILVQIFCLRLQLAHQLEEYLVCRNSTARSLLCRQSLEKFLSKEGSKLSLISLSQKGATHAQAEFKVEILGRAVVLVLQEEIPLQFKF